MADPTTDALPTPEQMRNYFAAAKSAQTARRLREASRAILTGNIAAGACLIETVLVAVHAGWFVNEDGAGDAARMLVLDGIIFGFLAWLFLAQRWLKRQRSRSDVFVLDHVEADAQRAPAHPARAVAILIGFLVVQVLAGVLWIIAFRHLSNAAIVAALSAFPLLAVGYFLYRFLTFLFWEDLLFAAAVAVAWTPFLFQAWHLAPLCLASFPMVIVGTGCLHYRWVHWQQSSALRNASATGEEVGA